MDGCHFTSVFDPVVAEIVFFRKPSTPAVSIDFEQAFIQCALVTLAMPCLRTEAQDAIKTRLKLWGVSIFHDRLPRNLPVQDILDIWDQVATITNHEKVMRLASHTGSTANPDFALRHYSKCGPNDETIAVLSFLGAVHGGGPGDNKVANRHDFQIQQKNALASFLIAQGADLQECVRFVDALLRGAGPEAIAAILGLRHHTKKWDGLVQLGESLSLPIPDIVTKVDKARKRMQTKYQEQAKMLGRNLPIEHLKLQEGFFQNVDETYCPQLTKVTPNSSGVVLASFNDAKPWLENGTSITQDELSLIVIGRCLHDAPGECEKIKVPVLLNDEPLVVSGCLHHLGSKKAVISVEEQQFPVNETQVISVTAFKDEIHEETWKQLVRHPVKCIFHILASEAGAIELLAPPWGRS